jgi:phosphoribosylanthranilate isomerase
VTTEPETQEPQPARTRVKVCGVTSMDDARAAVALDAWAVGMIMWPKSPRYVPLQGAAEIADATRRSAEVAGVFVDQPLDQVVGLATEIGLSIVQLHGSEGQQFCREVARRTGARVIKAFRVQGRDVLGELGRYYDVDFHLLDTYRAGVPGGTGETFEWDFLKGWRRGNVPLILSGGLTPENVGAAIELVGPYAVDVSSGVERGPGVKDHEKLTRFFAAVEAAVSPRFTRGEPALTGAEDEVLTLAWERRQQAERARQSK